MDLSVVKLFSFKGIWQILPLILLSVFALQPYADAVGFKSFETKLIFEPINRQIVDVRLELKNKLQDVYFYSLDGVKLNAWHIKAEGQKPTIIYCHGQGENISLWQSVAQALINNGYGVFMLEYRGHGRSEGEPSQTGLYLDLESAVKYLKEYEHIGQNNIVLWGRSLGGAVVADIASRDQFKGVILESTFTNIRDEAIHLTETGILESDLGFWGGISTKFIECLPITQKFETDHKISKITSPLLIAHSENDTTVPVEMSLQLTALNPKAHLFISKSGSHHESEWFIPRAIEFLKFLTG